MRLKTDRTKDERLDETLIDLALALVSRRLVQLYETTSDKIFDCPLSRSPFKYQVDTIN